MPTPIIKGDMDCQTVHVTHGADWLRFVTLLLHFMVEMRLCGRVVLR